MTSHNEGRGWTSAVEERRRLSFRESRQDSGEQGQITPVLLSGILCSSKLYFCPRELCLSKENKWEGGNIFVFPLLPPSTRFQLI